MQGAKERGVSRSNARISQSLTGKGVIGKVEGHRVALGNRLIAQENGLDRREIC